MGINKADVETDSLEAVNLILRSGGHHHQFSGLVEGCREKFRKNPRFLHRHIRRELNGVADFLAKDGLS